MNVEMRLYNPYAFFFPLATDDPPRPSFDSQLSRDMAGYMPARADFMEVSDVYRHVKEKVHAFSRLGFYLLGPHHLL